MCKTTMSYMHVQNHNVIHACTHAPHKYSSLPETYTNLIYVIGAKWPIIVLQHHVPAYVVTNIPYTTYSRLLLYGGIYTSY